MIYFILFVCVQFLGCCQEYVVHFDKKQQVLSNTTLYYYYYSRWFTPFAISRIPLTKLFYLAHFLLFTAHLSLCYSMFVGIFFSFFSLQLNIFWIHLVPCIHLMWPYQTNPFYSIDNIFFCFHTFLNINVVNMLIFDILQLLIKSIAKAYNFLLWFLFISHSSELYKQYFQYWSYLFFSLYYPVSHVHYILH